MHSRFTTRTRVASRPQLLRAFRTFSLDPGSNPTLRHLRTTLETYLVQNSHLSRNPLYAQLYPRAQRRAFRQNLVHPLPARPKRAPRCSPTRVPLSEPPPTSESLGLTPLDLINVIDKNCAPIFNDSMERWESVVNSGRFWGSALGEVKQLENLMDGSVQILTLVRPDWSHLGWAANYFDRHFKAQMDNLALLETDRDRPADNSANHWTVGNDTIAVRLSRQTTVRTNPGDADHCAMDEIVVPGSTVLVTGWFWCGHPVNIPQQQLFVIEAEDLLRIRGQDVTASPPYALLQYPE